MAGIQLKDGTHISVDFISSRLKGLSQKVIRVISSLVVAFVSCFLLIGSIRLVTWVYARGTVQAMGTWQAPVWIPYLFCMAIGFAILVIYSIIEFIFALKDSWR